MRETRASNPVVAFYLRADKLLRELDSSPGLTLYKGYEKFEDISSRELHQYPLPTAVHDMNPAGSFLIIFGLSQIRT